jgi:hypothetical protein
MGAQLRYRQQDLLRLRREATVRKHAQQGGFPANVVARVYTMIEPTTAE